VFSVSTRLLTHKPSALTTCGGVMDEEGTAWRLKNKMKIYIKK
jgi:hypothetical protein